VNGDLRDERGRFLPGNKPEPGPGRPRSDAAEKLRISLEEVIGNGTLPKWKAAMKKRLEKGDQWATEFVWDHLAGKVEQVSDVTLRVVYDSKRVDDPSADSAPQAS
jgi:hypothetical protein